MSFVTLSQQLTQLYLANKNGNLYIPPIFRRRFFDYFALKEKEPANTLLRPYQKSLVPDLQQPLGKKEAENRFLHFFNNGCRTYEHPGLNEFLYAQSCLGHPLKPQQEIIKLNKKKRKQEDEKLPVTEQMYLAHLEAKKKESDAAWQKYMEYEEAVRLAEHMAKNEMYFIEPDRNIIIQQRKSRAQRTPFILHGSVI